MVCYFENWAQYRPGARKMRPADIDPYMCTHVLYSFAKVTNNELAPYEWNDAGEGQLRCYRTDVVQNNDSRIKHQCHSQCRLVRRSSRLEREESRSEDSPGCGRLDSWHGHFHPNGKFHRLRFIVLRCCNQIVN